MNTYSSATFRFIHPLPRLVAGFTAGAAALALAGLVFGRAADDRALAFASVLNRAPLSLDARRGTTVETPTANQTNHVDTLVLAAAR